MALKDLLVVIDDAPAASARLDLAARLAVQHDAHLIGLRVLADPPRGGGWGGDAGDPAATLFEERMRRFGLTARSEWRVARGDPTDAVATHGRYVDLVVVGQTDPGHDTPGARPGDLVFECGRPLLVVPYAGSFARLGERVLIAWDGGREAARALGDARAILTAAKRVLVLTVNPRPGAEGLGAEPGADIARHLSRHFVFVEATSTVTDQIEPGDVILNTLADEACDLLVMGAYGHSRLRQFALGGVTRHMLQHMTVPVLMSH